MGLLKGRVGKGLWKTGRARDRTRGMLLLLLFLGLVNGVGFFLERTPLGLLLLLYWGVGLLGRVHFGYIT